MCPNHITNKLLGLFLSHVELYESSASRLDRCVDALAALQKTNACSETVSDLQISDLQTVSDLPFDPIRLNYRSDRVEQSANAYINEMGSIDRTRSRFKFDKVSRKMYTVSGSHG